MNNNKENFEKLFNLNVNDKVEVKDTGKVKLKYLSWSWAYAEFKKAYPDFTYEIKTFGEKKLPYQTTDLGIMVWTSITANGETREMWLPVMDGANRALKTIPYEIQVRDYNTKQLKTITLPPADMLDINKTIMRCLVKNMALFGLGLYIYANEDLPENESDTIINTNNSDKITEAQLKFIQDLSLDNQKICEHYGVDALPDLTMEQAKEIIRLKASKK